MEFKGWLQIAPAGAKPERPSRRRFAIRSGVAHN